MSGTVLVEEQDIINPTKTAVEYSTEIRSRYRRDIYTDNDSLWKMEFTSVHTNFTRFSVVGESVPRTFHENDNLEMRAGDIKGNEENGRKLKRHNSEVNT